MKQLSFIIVAVMLIVALSGCTVPAERANIAATTLPVYYFTERLCHDTDIGVTQLITENVSCLHDYTLTVDQMRSIESAQLIVISGAGLEDFLSDMLEHSQSVVDASVGIPLLCSETEHDHDNEVSHSHMHDPHIWLAPENAKAMARNICNALVQNYPQWETVFEANLAALDAEFEALNNYASSQLSSLSCRDLITFHDGFSYMAEAFDLRIVHAIEEEAGSEASAAELIELTQLVQAHQLDAVFTERNGSASAANIIASETGVELFQLDMGMSGTSYFDAMYHNIDTLKEALE